MQTYEYLLVKTRVYEPTEPGYYRYECKFRAIAEGGDAESVTAVEQAEKKIEVLNRLGALGWKLASTEESKWIDELHAKEYTFIRKTDG